MAIVLRDLQSVLQKELGNELIVVSYESENLLANGENYWSTILKVEALIKRSKNAPEEKLHLVAKMNVTGDFQKEHFNSTGSFVKETFFFEELIPTYRKLQSKMGFQENELINVIPEYYGSRLSLNPDNKHADDDVVILMENLKVKGYKTMDRRNGLDFQHAKPCIAELAKFHALGIACKEIDPNFVEKARPTFGKPLITKVIKNFKEATETLVASICEDPKFAKYAERIKIARQNVSLLRKDDSVSKWSTFMHGDFWVNNVLYRHNEQNQIEDMKFIDFQKADFDSLARDLPYFLFGSCNIDVVQNNFNELLDTYYNTFINILKRMECNVEKYSRIEFDKELKTVANDEFFRCLWVTKVFTFDSDDSDLEDIVAVLASKPNELYLKRCYQILEKYQEMNWF